MTQKLVYPENIEDIRGLASAIDGKIKTSEHSYDVMFDYMNKFIDAYDKNIITYNKLYEVDNEKDFDYSIFEDCYIEEYSMEGAYIAHKYMRDKLSFYRKCIKSYKLAIDSLKKQKDDLCDIKFECNRQIEKLS